MAKSGIEAKLDKLKRRLQKHPCVDYVRITALTDTDQKDNVFIIGKHKGCLLVRIHSNGKSAVMTVRTLLSEKPFERILHPKLQELSLKFD